MIVNGLYLYSALPVFWPLKALYTTCPIHTHSHTDATMQGAIYSSEAETNHSHNLGFSILPVYFDIQTGVAEGQTGLPISGH